jgi:hypothetical protein
MDGVVERSFGEVNFGGLELGDARRTKRLIQLVDVMARHPGGTLPAKLSESHELRAFYRIVDAKQVTHESVMQRHYAATRNAINNALAEGAPVLVIHDATELDYTNISALQEHLGQIGEGTHRGYICHNSLAVRGDTKETLGLTSQILHHRADVPDKETEKQRRERADRESRLWVRGAQQSGVFAIWGMVVDVSDSLSDTFEYMYYEIDNSRHFLLRSRENRKLHTPINGQQYLYEGVRSWRSRDSYTVKVTATSKRKAREAVVNISFGEVTLAPPGKRSGDYEEEPLTMSAVRVWEPNPPEGEEALEWILLTNVEVRCIEDARTRAEWYGDRFIIEDYHKGMKTGCGIETLQFDTIDRLEPTIGVISILATKLMKMRDAARQPDADVRPATEVVDEIYVEVLTHHYGKRIGKAPSVKQFYMHVARLGGHQNRKGDGFPGWITLWRGWIKLESAVVGYRLALRKKGRKCGVM